MAIGLDSYANGTKETWRGWQWNCIAGMLCSAGNRGTIGSWKGTGRQRQKELLLCDKTVLYLCGPDPFDRDVALRHGFSDWNLIAVDVQKDNVTNARGNGGLAICASIQDVLCNWPDDWKIDAVVADFCCGLGDVARGLAFALWKCKGIREHADTLPVVSINLQRGRDAETNDLREKIQVVRMIAGDLESDTLAFVGESLGRDGNWKVDPKNRAAMWLDWMHGEWLTASFGFVTLPHPTDPTKELLGVPPIFNCDDFIAAYAVSRIAIAPHFYSYRSRSTTMDSAVFSFPPSLLKMDGLQDNSEWDQMLDYYVSDKAYYGRARRRDTKAKLSALRAVRTMKMRQRST